MTYAYQSHIYLAEAVLNVKDLTNQTAFLSPDYWLGDFIPNRDRSDFGTWSKSLGSLIQAEKSGEVKGALWALPSGDFVADTKSLGRCLETSK